MFRTGDKNQMLPLKQRIECVDGVGLSVHVGEGMCCRPRTDEGPHYEVEVCFILDADGATVTPPDTWRKYIDDEEFPSDVYGYVPIELVEAFIESHGGRLVDSSGQT